MQLDYILSGYTFSGVPITNANFHIQSFAFDDSGNVSVNVQIFFDLPMRQNGAAPLITTQYNFAASEGQTIAQVWQALQVDPVAGLLLNNGTLVSE